MKTVDLIRLSGRMFKSRMSRTLLTIAGVSIGIGTILFLVSLGYGLQQLLLERITTSEALLTIDVSPGESEALALTPSIVEGFLGLDGVDSVSPRVDLPAQIGIGDLTSDIVVNLVNPDFFVLSGIEPPEGEVYQEGERGALVSRAFALLFGLESDKVIGQEIDLTLFVPTTASVSGSTAALGDLLDLDVITFDERDPLRIVGVLEDEAQPQVFIPLSLLDERVMSFYQLVKVKATDTASLAGVREHIAQQGFSVSALSDLVDQANKIFVAFQVILGIFGIFALLVSAIGLINTMTIALLERTQEIGVMKSIGASRRDIANLFLTESSLIGLLGGIFGVFIGYAAGEGFNLFINILAQNLGGEPVDLFARPIWFVATIIVFSAIVGVVAGILPARRAARINPLSAIKYK